MPDGSRATANTCPDSESRLPGALPRTAATTDESSTGAAGTACYLCLCQWLLLRTRDTHGGMLHMHLQLDGMLIVMGRHKR